MNEENQITDKEREIADGEREVAVEEREIAVEESEIAKEEERLPRWNWGAFALNFIWGIGHKCYWPLLCVIPVFGTFWMFVCGFMGNRWAWKAGSYRSVEEFKTKELGWSIAGVVVTCLIAMNVINFLYPYFFPSGAVVRLKAY